MLFCLFDFLINYLFYKIKMYILIFFIIIKQIIGQEELIDLQTYTIFSSLEILYKYHYKYSNPPNLLLLNHKYNCIESLMMINEKGPNKTNNSIDNLITIFNLDINQTYFLKFKFKNDDCYDTFFIYNYNITYFIENSFIIEFWHINNYSFINFTVDNTKYNLIEISSNEYNTFNLNIYNKDNQENIDSKNNIDDGYISYILNCTYQKTLINIDWWNYGYEEEYEDDKDIEFDDFNSKEIIISIISSDKYNIYLLKEKKELKIPIHILEENGKKLFFIDLNSSENLNKSSIYLKINNLDIDFKIQTYYTNYSQLNNDYSDTINYEILSSFNYTNVDIDENTYLIKIDKDFINNTNSILMEYSYQNYGMLNDIEVIIIELYPEIINNTCTKNIKTENKTFFIYKQSYNNSDNLIIYSNQTKHIIFENNLFSNKILNLYIIPIDIFEKYSLIKFTIIGNKNDSNIINFYFTNRKINLYNNIFNYESIFVTPEYETYYIFKLNNPYQKEIVYLDIEYGNLEIYKNNYKSIDEIFDNEKFIKINDYFEIKENDVYKIICSKPSRFTFRSHIIQNDNLEFNDKTNLYSISLFVTKNKTNYTIINNKGIKNIYYQIQLFPKNNNTITNISINNDNRNLTNNSPIIYNDLNVSKNIKILIDSNENTLLTFYFAFPFNYTSPMNTETNKSIVFKIQDNTSKFLIINNKENELKNFGYYLSKNNNNNTNLSFFNQSNLIYLESKKEYLIDLDNTSKYISIYSKNLLNYTFINYSYIKSNFYSQELIEFNSNIKYKTFEYNYQSDEIESMMIDVRYLEGDEYNPNLMIIIHKYKKEIYKILKEKEISSKDIKIFEIINQQSNIIHINNYPDIGKDYFYITFYVSSFFYEEVIDMKYTFQVYNPKKYYLITNDTFKLKLGIIENITFHFKYDKKQFDKKYINYDWHNDKINVKCRINFKNNGNDNDNEYKISYRGYKQYDYNKEYEIIFDCINNSTEYSLLNLFIYLSDDSSIKQIQNNNTINSFIIVSPNIVFLYNNITDEGIGEIITYNLTLRKQKIQPKILFNETVDFDEIIKIKNLNIFEKMNSSEKDIFSLTKKEKNFVIIGIEINNDDSFESMNETLTYQKIQKDILVLNNYEKVFISKEKEEIKKFIITKESFLTHLKIVLYSTKNTTIFFKNINFTNNNTNIFIISKNDFQTNITFKVKTLKDENFTFKIILLNNNIKYINSNIRKNEHFSLMNDNENDSEIYILGIYENNESFIYIYNYIGNLTIKYKNNVNNIERNEDLLKFDNNTYNYPFFINSRIDFFKFSCLDFCQFEVRFFNNLKNEIKLIEGIHIPIYIYRNNSLSFNITYNMENKIKFEIDLIINENNRNIKIELDNDKFELNNNNTNLIIKDNTTKPKKIKFIGDENFDSLILISNFLNITTIIDKKVNLRRFDNLYSIFIVKKPDNFSTFTNIYIKCDKCDNNIYQIYYFISYGKTDKVYAKEYSCYNISKENPLSLSIEGKNYGLESEKFNTFYVFYIKNNSEFLYSYDFYEYSKDLDFYQPKKILISKNNYRIFRMKFSIMKYNIKENKNIITFLFKNNNLDGKLYLYSKNNSISMNNNKFENYLVEKKLNETTNNIFHLENDVINDTFYFIIQAGLNEINNIIEIYYNKKIIEIENNCYKSFKFINSTNFLFYIKKGINSYINIQWININSESLIEIKTDEKSELTFQNYFKENSIFYQLDPKFDYLINITENIINNNNISSLAINFHFYNNKIINLRENENIDIPIISKQILYFYISISRIPAKEVIEFQIQKNKDIKYEIPKRKFTNETIENMINENKTEYEEIKNKEDENNNIIYSFPNIENSFYQSVLIEINITSVNNSHELGLKNLTISLINRKKLIKYNFKKKFLKNETGYYYINKSSFKISNYITIQSDKLNQIKFEPNIFSFENKSFYLIQQKMLENINEINIKFGNNEENFFYITVNYINKEDEYTIFPIIFYETKQKIEPLTINIDNENYKPIILIYSFKKFSKEYESILYIKKDDQNTDEVFRNDSIDFIDKIFKNEYEEYEYTYPDISKNEYEILLFNNVGTYTIFFYEYIKNEVVIDDYGRTFPLFITTNINYTIRVNEKINNINFKIKLETRNDNEDFFYEIYYDDITLKLFLEETIIYGHLNKTLTELEFKILKGKEFLIFFSICYPNSKVYSIKKDLTQIEQNYNIFSYPKENITDFGIITFKNTNNTTLNIFYEEIISITNSSFSLNQSKNFASNIIFNYYFENPISYYNPKTEEEKIIVFFIPNYYNIKYNFNLYKKEYIYNFNKTDLNPQLSNTNINYIQIFYYDENKGEKKINFIFNETINRSVILYIYNNISNIIFMDNEFKNYIKSQDLLNSKIFYDEIKDETLYFIFYFKEPFPFSFTFIDLENPYNITLNDGQEYLELYTNGKKKQIFIFNYVSDIKGANMHIQWKIFDEKVKGQLYINDESPKNPLNSKNEYSYFLNLTDGASYIFKLVIENINQLKSITIFVNFFLSYFQNILSFNDKDSFSFPILVKQQYYFIQNISLYSINEENSYYFSNNFNVSISTKFCNENPYDVLNNSDYEKTDFTEKDDDLLEEDELSKSIKIKEKFKFLILKIDFNPKKRIYKKNFNISKNITVSIIKSNQTIEIKDGVTKHFKFDLNSKSYYILLYTNTVNALSVLRNDDYPKKKNLYIINKEMLKKNLIFEAFDEYFSYSLNILYISNKKKIHVLNRKEIKNFSYRILINNCSIENYYFGNFEKKKTYLYIEILYGDVKIKMKNITDNNDINLDNFFDFETNVDIYEKPIINTNNYNFFKFECNSISLLNIKYYSYNEFVQQKIEINYGNEFGWLLKNNIHFHYKIKNNSQIFTSEFNYEISLLHSLDDYNVNFNFNNQEEQLNKDNGKYIRKKCNKIELDKLDLLADNYENLLLFKIGLNSSSYESIEKYTFKEKINKTYVIFFYPKKSTLKYINITIKKIKQESSGKICLNEGYSEVDYVNFMETECFNLDKEKNKSYITNNSFIYNKSEDSKFYSAFYFENPKNFEVYFSSDESNNNKNYLYIVIIILLSVLLIIFMFLYFKKNKSEYNNDVTISLINENIQDKVINYIEDDKDAQDW